MKSPTLKQVHDSMLRHFKKYGPRKRPKKTAKGWDCFDLKLYKQK